jgi:pyruvate formate-lyase/glycerol dehydratase family glycyl radical enzyme
MHDTANKADSVFSDKVINLPNEMTDRIYNLKENIFNNEPEWITERGRLITEAYRKHEPQHLYVKRAKAFAHILKNRTLYIQDGELIIGNYAAKHSCYEMYPEYSLQDLPARYVNFKMETLLSEDSFAAESDKQIFREIKDFWQGRNMRDISDSAMPEDLVKLRDRDFCCNPYGRDEGQGHIVVQYDRVVREGIRAIIDEAQARLDETRLNDPKGYHFLKAVIISLEAVVDFAHRLAFKAEELITQTDDENRKKELKTIAYNLKVAPEFPAQNFWQGIQAAWLIHLLMHIEQNGFSISVGRIDQYLYPLYKKDLEEGLIDEKFAFELIQNFYVKCMELTIGGLKISLTQTVTLGGRDKDGNDMSNDLSLMCIKADRATQMVQPQTTLRWHKNINPKLVDEILEGTYQGQATYAIVNDEVLIPGMVKWDVKEEDAIDYALIGCNETEIPGKMLGGGLCRPIVVSRVLDLTLHGGEYRYADVLAELAPEYDHQWRMQKDKKNPIFTRKGKKLGEFSGIDDILEEFRKHVAICAEKLVAAANIMDDLHAHYRPLPFASSLMNGCIQRGRDLMVETDYFHWAVGLYDVVSVVNSLAAIEKCVFEDKIVTQQQLLDAIDNNWQGYEDLHTYFRKAPKFGNDDDYADKYLDIVSTICVEELGKYRSLRSNGTIWLEAIARAAHVFTGSHTKASPDGRRDWEAMPPSISAQSGTDTSGPTALLNSYAKTRADQYVGGVISNIRFHPDLLDNPESRKKVLELINAYFKKGGVHIQINCVNKETLLKAQKEPEKYRDLLVRVSGYVDYWNNLDRRTQEEIIQRTVMTD